MCVLRKMVIFFYSSQSKTRVLKIQNERILKMKYIDYNKNNLDISKFNEYVQANIEMNGDNTVKNYKVMCSLIGEEVLNGASKKAQLNRWKRYFDFHKDGQRFVIDEIYDEPFVSDDQRFYRHFKGEEKFLISKEHRTSKGVYIIQENNDVYIGSTCVSFIKRFTQHHNHTEKFCMPHTKELINRPNAQYRILYLANDTDSEKTIRKKEEYYIQEYISKGYNVINRQHNTTIYNRSQKTNDNKKYVSRKLQIEYDIKFPRTELTQLNKYCKLNYSIVHISSKNVYLKKQV